MEKKDFVTVLSEGLAYALPIFIIYMIIEGGFNG